MRKTEYIYYKFYWRGANAGATAILILILILIPSPYNPHTMPIAIAMYLPSHCRSRRL